MTSELDTNPQQPKQPLESAEQASGSADRIDISEVLNGPNPTSDVLPRRPLSKAERLAAEAAERKAQRRLPSRGIIALATAAAAVITGGIGVGIGMNASNRGNGEGQDIPTAGAPATPAGTETTSMATEQPATAEASEPASTATEPTTETPETVSAQESYTGPIPLEQLVVHESTKTFEELDQMTDMEAFAKESPANRAFWAHNFVTSLITDNTAGVDTNDHDANSFDDANFTGGTKTLLNMHDVYAHVGEMDEAQARKLALARNYDPLDPATGELSSQMREIMDVYASQASGHNGDTPVPYAREETAWTLTPDTHRNKEWMKVVFYQEKRTSETDYSGDRTIQIVRMTVKDPSTGAVDVWPMYGNSRSGNAIDELTSPIR